MRELGSKASYPITELSEFSNGSNSDCSMHAEYWATESPVTLLRFTKLKSCESLSGGTVINANVNVIECPSIALPER